MRTAPLNPAHRDVAADPCSDCPAPAGVLCEPYCPASLGVEFITLDGGHLDSAVCVDECRNRCDLNGFVPVFASGALASDEGKRWQRDGLLVACADCGRVVSQRAVLDDGEHVQVLFQLDVPPVEC